MRARVSLVGAAATAALLARPRLLRWGATGQECGEALPGDELIEHADLTATRAITIHAPADDVWPWSAQLGQGRGGFYSYDFLENLVGCDIHSADRIVPEWQDVAVGDAIRLAPQMALAVATDIESPLGFQIRDSVGRSATQTVPGARITLPHPEAFRETRARRIGVAPAAPADPP